MTDERRAHQCHRPGCDSEAQWTVRVMLLAETAGGNRVLMNFDCSIKTCDAHRRHVPDYVLSDRNKTAITAALEQDGYGTVDFDTARIEFVPIEHAPAPPIVIADRRAALRPCDRDGCVLPAKWQVSIRFNPIGQKRRTATVLTGLCTCQQHRAATTRADVLTQESKSRLLGQLAARGCPMPDFATAIVDFVPLDHGRKVDPAAFARGEV